MKRIVRRALLGIGFVLFVFCLVSVTTKQCENYRIQSISFQKVNLINNDSSLLLDNDNRNYYLLHFDVEYCNCRYTFFDAPNPYFIKGSVENIINAFAFDSCDHNLINNFKALNLKNIFIIKTNGIDTNGFYCSSINFNEIILQINNKKGYGERNNIRNDCLIYLDTDQRLPQKIILKFTSYSIECLVNNDPRISEIEKFEDNGKPVLYNW